MGLMYDFRALVLDLLGHGDLVLSVLVVLTFLAVGILLLVVMMLLGHLVLLLVLLVSVGKSVSAHLLSLLPPLRRLLLSWLLAFPYSVCVDAAALSSLVLLVPVWRLEFALALSPWVVVVVIVAVAAVVLLVLVCRF